jgi:hypothetical protein
MFSELEATKGLTPEQKSAYNQYMSLDPSGTLPERLGSGAMMEFVHRWAAGGTPSATTDSPADAIASGIESLTTKSGPTPKGQRATQIKGPLSAAAADRQRAVFGDVKRRRISPTIQDDSGKRVVQTPSRMFPDTRGKIGPDIVAARKEATKRLGRTVTTPDLIEALDLTDTFYSRMKGFMGSGDYVQRPAARLEAGRRYSGKQATAPAVKTETTAETIDARNAEREATKRASFTSSVEQFKQQRAAVTAGLATPKPRDDIPVYPNRQPLVPPGKGISRIAQEDTTKPSGPTSPIGTPSTPSPATDKADAAIKARRASAEDSRSQAASEKKKETKKALKEKKKK